MTRKIFYIGLIVILGIAIFVRIGMVNLRSKQEAVGTEQIYKTSGIPVEIATVKKGPFTVDCKVNAMVSGIKQTTISTPVAAKILKVHYQVGDFVKADEPIISLDKEDPRSSSQYRQLKAVYDTTLKTYERMNDLHKKGAISQSELDTIKMKLDVDKANLDSVLKTLYLSSPMSGIILNINAREGELITPMTPVAIVAKIDRLRLTAFVSESDIMRIKEGQRVLVNGTNGQEISIGHVTKASLSAVPGTGLFMVEMETDNKDGFLNVGVYTSVKIEVVNDPQAIFVDLRGLQQDSQGRFYAFVAEEKTAKKVMVDVSGMNDEYARITSGLKEGDKVVVKGFNRLSDNVKIAY